MIFFLLLTLEILKIFQKFLNFFVWVILLNKGHI